MAQAGGQVIQMVANFPVGLFATLPIDDAVIAPIRRSRNCRSEAAGTEWSTGDHISPSIASADAVLLRAEQLVGNVRYALDYLVPVEGVEPPTFALRMRCSTN